MMLSTKNIEEAIKNLKNQIVTATKHEEFLVIPMSERCLSKRYSGKGRPKKIDYDYNPINLVEIMKGVNK